jgi:hypothetical protein
MTFYEANPEVRSTGAEVDEFVDAPMPEPAAPLSPGADVTAARDNTPGSQEPPRRRGSSAGQLLRIYANDHRAGAAGGLALAQRALQNNGDSALGRELATLIEEFRSDEAMLISILRHLSIPENRTKQVAARAGEFLGRMKFNGRVRGYSPLSRLLEVEMLLAAIDAKRSLWRSLTSAGVEVPAEVNLRALEARATDQRDRLRAHHREAAREALRSA